MTITLWPKLKAGFLSLLETVLPPRCPATGALVGAQGTLAPDYWKRLHFIHAPLCVCCGNPFAHDAAVADMLCGRCMAERPVFDAARAALAYDDASSALLLKFKYADKTLLAHSFAAWMAQSGADILATADYLVPVPLHRWRLLKRRYNQANLLAAALSVRTGTRLLPMALRRVRATESQGRKTNAQRADNVRGVFAVRDADVPALHDKHVVLIDDVMTSGATVTACAKILREAGARRVDVLTAARVVHTV